MMEVLRVEYLQFSTTQVVNADWNGKVGTRKVKSCRRCTMVR